MPAKIDIKHLLQSNSSAEFKVSIFILISTLIGVLLYFLPVQIIKGNFAVLEEKNLQVESTTTYQILQQNLDYQRQLTAEMARQSDLYQQLNQGLPLRSMALDWHYLEEVQSINAVLLVGKGQRVAFYETYDAGLGQLDISALIMPTKLTQLLSNLNSEHNDHAFYSQMTDGVFSVTIHRINATVPYLPSQNYMILGRLLDNAALAKIFGDDSYQIADNDITLNWQSTANSQVQSAYRVIDNTTLAHFIKIDDAFSDSFVLTHIMTRSDHLNGIAITNTFRNFFLATYLMILFSLFILFGGYFRWLRRSNKALVQQLKDTGSQQIHAEMLLIDALDSSVSPIAITDDEMLLLYANPVFCKRIGTACNQVVNHYLDTIIDDFPMRINKNNGLAEVISFEVNFHDEHGAKQPVTVFQHPMYYHGKDTVLFIIGPSPKVNAPTNALNEAFMRELVHETKTPLQAITGFSRLLKERDNAAQNAIDIIYHNAIYMSNLIDNTYAWYLTNQPEQTLALQQRFSIVELIDDIVMSLSLSAEQKGLTIDVQHQIIDSTVIAQHRDRIRQILYNLIQNAIKFTDYGKIIVKLQCICHDDIAQIAIDVCDSGIGISQREFSLIEQGVQTTTGKRKGGMGIGLALSKKLASQIGGELSHIANNNKQGSTFRLTFYSDLTKLDELAGTDTTYPIDNTLLAYKLLIVDDEAISRQLIVRQMRELGFEIAEATSGEEAIDITENFKLDILLIDIRLPGINGRLCADVIKQKNAALKTIFQTAYPLEPSDDINAIADGIIKKPYNHEQLIALISDIVKK